jgi:flagellar basal-body rod protein FlgG
MLRALYASAAGMQSQQTNLDVIANNLANVNTTGFKKSKAEFQDLLYQNTRTAGAEVGAGNQLPTGIQIGHGSKLVATSKVFTTGELTQTQEQWDIAINGDGFFEVQTTNGDKAFTRDGSFKVGPTGQIMTSDGLIVQSGFQALPPGTTSVDVSSTGEVTYSGPNGKTTFRLALTRFANPAGLENMGHNLYKETTASGPAEVGAPGEQGFGTTQQYYLELSNVKVVEEMVNMILAQRAYEINSKAVQASDEMMQLSNNLRR